LCMQMTNVEIESLKTEFNTALSVWHDQMHELPTGELVDMILKHLPMSLLMAQLINIEHKIKLLNMEDDCGSRKKTE